MDSHKLRIAVIGLHFGAAFVPIYQSHPNHEFVRSIVERRPPAIDALTSAEWTLPGICAHESALRGGEPVVIPDMRI